ncbi:MAG: hypothetical protein CMM91_10815 [Rickettsiales bacterium]|nr:hypothetical protein [Rickettsiales bacterium]OUV52956.1 MAG: hypothetical protein CBC87_06300 [Rickettsiales bacterium TMED127]
MNKFSKKIAVAAIPAVMALSASAVDSKQLLMSEGGWEISFDGAANAFYNVTNSDATNDATFAGANTVTTFETAGDFIASDGAQTSSISVGLLPNVFGFTIKAPTSNGLDVSGRLGIYTHMNADGSSAASNAPNMRETSFTVAGSFGSILAGRHLGLWQRKAIVNDVTLFGVGGTAGNITGTTLGRIGSGYVYADWYPQIQWTLPTMGAVTATVSLLQATPLISTTANYGATETATPRVEVLIDANHSFGGADINFWLDGQFQELERTTTQTTTVRAGATAYNGASTDEADAITAYGVGAGAKITVGSFDLVASFFKNRGVGIQFQGNTGGSTYSGALDAVGKARHFYGGYIQAHADLGGGTNAAFSYGQNKAVATGSDIESLTVAERNTVEHWNGMLWHNLTDDFRVIAEGSYSEQSLHMGGSQDSTNVSLGAFFFW